MGKTIKQPVLGRPLDARRGGEGSFPKPAELIEIVELKPLTLNDRRVWNLLMIHAWPYIAEDRQHVISKAILRGSHTSTDNLTETIRRLMTTLIEVMVIYEGKV